MGELKRRLGPVRAQEIATRTRRDVTIALCLIVLVLMLLFSIAGLR
jgi:hypothetical protein